MHLRYALLVALLTESELSSEAKVCLQLTNKLLFVTQRFAGP